MYAVFNFNDILKEKDKFFNKKTEVIFLKKIRFLFHTYSTRFAKFFPDLRQFFHVKC